MTKTELTTIDHNFKHIFGNPYFTAKNLSRYRDLYTISEHLRQRDYFYSGFNVEDVYDRISDKIKLWSFLTGDTSKLIEELDAMLKK